MGRDEEKKKQPNCIRNRQLNMFLAIILGPIFLICLIDLGPHINIFPVLSMSQCYDPDQNYYKYINWVMTNFVVFNTLHNLMLFAMCFLLRNIDDNFNIGKEIRYVCCVATLCLTTYTFMILFHDNTPFVTLGYC